jgi:hypothetical protein
VTPSQVEHALRAVSSGGSAKGNLARGTPGHRRAYHPHLAVSWITENGELLLGLAGIFGTLAGTWIGVRAGLHIERKRQEFDSEPVEGLSFAATPGQGDSEGGDVHSP